MASGARKCDAPAGLAALYARTRLNVHPPRYDAFGMSIVEAAAFGAPTVFPPGADVGAKRILSFRGDDAFFEMDLDGDGALDPLPPDLSRPATAARAVAAADGGAPGPDGLRARGPPAPAPALRRPRRPRPRLPPRPRRPRRPRSR